MMIEWFYSQFIQANCELLFFDFFSNDNLWKSNFVSVLSNRHFRMEIQDELLSLLFMMVRSFILY